MLSADLVESLTLWRDHKRGDEAATAEFASMFLEPEPCFLCDHPATGGDYLVVEDPARPAQRAIISMLCADCMARPTQQRMHRINVMLKAMFGSRIKKIQHLPVRK